MNWRAPIGEASNEGADADIAEDAASYHRGSLRQLSLHAWRGDGTKHLPRIPLLVFYKGWYMQSIGLMELPCRASLSKTAPLRTPI
jgi:hypothetical protein